MAKSMATKARDDPSGPRPIRHPQPESSPPFAPLVVPEGPTLPVLVPPVELPPLPVDPDVLPPVPVEVPSEPASGRIPVGVMLRCTGTLTDAGVAFIALKLMVASYSPSATPAASTVTASGCPTAPRTLPVPGLTDSHAPPAAAAVN